MRKLYVPIAVDPTQNREQYLKDFRDLGVDHVFLVCGERWPLLGDALWEKWMDMVDEAVYKALCSYHKLRQEEYFDTWITRILLNECHKEFRRKQRFSSIDELPEKGEENKEILTFIVHWPALLLPLLFSL